MATELRSIHRNKARACLEALRMGIVSRESVEHVTVGRDTELSQILDHVATHRRGSAQVVIGAYGAGKSHLALLLEQRLLSLGYVVATIELGGSETAERPDVWLDSIRRHVRARVQGEDFSGEYEISLYLLAKGDAEDLPWYVHRDVKEAFARLPAGSWRIRRNLLRKHIEQAYPDTSLRTTYCRLFNRIPSEMTAGSELAIEVTNVSRRCKGPFNGMVLIIDEAERSDWANNSHRLKCAQNNLLWFTCAGLNVDVQDLKTYRNYWRTLEYPTRLHVIALFAHEWMACWDIIRRGAHKRHIAKLDTGQARQAIIKVAALYAHAYDRSPAVPGHLYNECAKMIESGDTRTALRKFVSALDYYRIWHDGG